MYYDNTVLEKIEKLRKIKKDHLEYDTLSQHIISVGEFDIQK